MEDQSSVETEIKNAGALARGTAFMFDLFFCITIGQLVGGLVLVVIRGDVERHFSIFLGISATVAFALLFLQEVFLRTTFGKTVLGLSIESSTEKPLTKSRLLLHSLLKILWVIDAVVIAFSKKKKSIANHLSRTKIVWKSRSLLQRTGLLLGGVLVLALSFSGTFLVSSLTYSNTEIAVLAQTTLDRIIREQVSPEKGTLTNPHLGPIQVVIRNNSGLVSLQYTGTENEPKYVSLVFTRNGSNWEFVNGEVLSERPNPNFSITYATNASELDTK